MSSPCFDKVVWMVPSPRFWKQLYTTTSKSKMHGSSYWRWGVGTEIVEDTSRNALKFLVLPTTGRWSWKVRRKSLRHWTICPRRFAQRSWKMQMRMICFEVSTRTSDVQDVKMIGSPVPVVRLRTAGVIPILLGELGRTPHQVRPGQSNALPRTPSNLQMHPTSPAQSFPSRQPNGRMHNDKLKAALMFSLKGAFLQSHKAPIPFGRRLRSRVATPSMHTLLECQGGDVCLLVPNVSKCWDLQLLEVPAGQKGGGTYHEGSRTRNVEHACRNSLITSDSRLNNWSTFGFVVTVVTLQGPESNLFAPHERFLLILKVETRNRTKKMQHGNQQTFAALTWKSWLDKQKITYHDPSWPVCMP